jgi:transposase
LRQEVRRDLLAESAAQQATKRLRQIPSIGPIRAALLMALLQTPYRFRTKRQLWAYSGLGIETHDSGEHRYIEGELRRSKKKASVRGLNRNYNRDLKNLFKGAATQASVQPGPLQEFYATLLAKGIRPEMARLTLARKMAAITLTMWKKGVDFDAKQLHRQVA